MVHPNSTADRVLSALAAYGLRPAGPDRWRSNSPLRPGSDSHSLALRITDSEYGTWYDHVANEGGSLYELAEKIGIERPARPGPAPSTKRAYTDLADYAGAHYTPADAYRAAGWSDAVVKERCPRTRRMRPALPFTTDTGTRWRFIDGADDGPPYKSPAGYAAAWYRLTEAVALAAAGDLPLVLCNGEASTVAAQHHGVPATAITGGGERTIPAGLMQALLDSWHGPIVIVPDADDKGKRSTPDRVKQLRDAGYQVSVMALNGPKGYDLADFCGLYAGDSARVIAERATIEPVEAPTVEAPAAERSAIPPAAISAAELLAMNVPPIRWYVPGILREGLALLVGAPFVGKTPLAAQLAIDLAAGARWMGRYDTTPVPTLYVGTEYSRADVVTTLRDSLGAAPAPDRLYVRTIEDIPDLPTPADALAWLESEITATGAAVVVIDVLTGFLPSPPRSNQSAYRSDYSELRPYQVLALRLGVCILGCWHAAKREADPALMYSGSSGLWGAAGGGRLCLYRDPDDNVRLASFARGGERIDLVLEQQRNTAGGRRWYAGAVSDTPAGLTKRLADVYRAVADAGRPVGPGAIHDAIGDAHTLATVKSALNALLKKGHLTNLQGLWSIAPSQASQASHLRSDLDDLNDPNDPSDLDDPSLRAAKVQSFAATDRGDPLGGDTSPHWDAEDRPDRQDRSDLEIAAKAAKVRRCEGDIPEPLVKACDAAALQGHGWRAAEDLARHDPALTGYVDERKAEAATPITIEALERGLRTGGRP